MSQIDKFLEKAGQVADAAVKTGSGLVAKGRDKAEEVSLQTKQAKLHRQLGALVYALRKNDEENEPMLAWYISEIDRINARMANLKAGAADEETEVGDFQVYYGAGTEDEGDAMFRGGDGDELP